MWSSQCSSSVPMPYQGCSWQQTCHQTSFSRKRKRDATATGTARADYEQSPDPGEIWAQLVISSAVLECRNEHPHSDCNITKQHFRSVAESMCFTSTRFHIQALKSPIKRTLSTKGAQENHLLDRVHRKVVRLI